MRRATGWFGAATVLLILLSSVPASAETREGTWSGETDQHKAIRFKVDPEERIAFIRVTIEYENADCITQVRWEFGLSTRIRDDGTFRLSLTDELDDRDTALILGEFTSRRRASGTYRSTIAEGGGCGRFQARGTWTTTKG